MAGVGHRSGDDCRNIGLLRNPRDPWGWISSFPSTMIVTKVTRAARSWSCLLVISLLISYLIKGSSGVEGDPNLGQASCLVNTIGEDHLIPEVEMLLHTPKTAREPPRASRRHSVPSEIEMRVEVQAAHVRPLILRASKRGSRCVIRLTDSRGVIIREYNRQYGSHVNPDGTEVGFSHKHFPTREHPLPEKHQGLSTWAYEPEEAFPEDFLSAIKAFCCECNISVEALSTRLEWF